MRVQMSCVLVVRCCVVFVNFRVWYLQGIMTNVHFVNDVIGQLEIIVAHVGVAELGS